MQAWPALFGIGIIGLVGSLIIAIPGIGYLAGIGPEDYDDDEKFEVGFYLLGVCTPIVFIPSLIFFFFGWRGYRRNKKLLKIANLLRGYRNMHIAELAERLGRSRGDTEAAILECINEGHIQGYIDASSKRFIVTEPPPPMQPIQPMPPGPVMVYPNVNVPVPPPPPPPQYYPSQPPSNIPSSNQQRAQKQKQRKTTADPPDRLKPSRKA